MPIEQPLGYQAPCKIELSTFGSQQAVHIFSCTLLEILDYGVVIRTIHGDVQLYPFTSVHYVEYL